MASFRGPPDRHRRSSPLRLDPKRPWTALVSGPYIASGYVPFSPALDMMVASSDAFTVLSMIGLTCHRKRHVRGAGRSRDASPPPSSRARWRLAPTPTHTEALIVVCLRSGGNRHGHRDPRWSSTSCRISAPSNDLSSCGHAYTAAAQPIHGTASGAEHLEVVPAIVEGLATGDFAAIETAASRMCDSRETTVQCKNVGVDAPGFAERAMAWDSTPSSRTV